MSEDELPTEFEVHPENYYRAFNSDETGSIFLREGGASQARDRKHIKSTALALACAIYDSDPVHALSSKGRYAGLHSLQSVNLFVGDADHEGFLVGVEGRRVYIAFCGSQIDWSARGSTHLVQMADFDMTAFGGAKYLANGADLKGMSGYMQAMNNAACDLAYFVLKGFNHIIVCGHSRGGAIAFLKLIKYYISNNVDASKYQDENAPLTEAIAFGSPYCVNEPVVHFLNSRNLSLRFTTVANHDDIVAAIIPTARAASPEMFQQFFSHVKSTSSSLVAVCMDLAKRQLEDVANDKKRFNNYHPLGVYEFLGSQGESSSCFGAEAVDLRLSKFMSCYIQDNSDRLFSPHLIEEYIARASIAYGPIADDSGSMLEPLSGDVISLMPEVHGVSGEVFKNGSYTALKLTIFGENLDFMEPRIKTLFSGRVFHFKVNRTRPRQLVFSSINKDFDLYAGENLNYEFELRPMWKGSEPYKHSSPIFSLFTPHVGVEALLYRMFKVRYLLLTSGRLHFDSSTHAAVSRLLQLDKRAVEDFDDLCCSRDRLEKYVISVILPRCLKKVTVQTKLAKNIEFAGKLVIGLAIGAGVAFGGMMFFTGALEGTIVAGSVAAGFVTQALNTVEILQKEVEQSQQYIETITSIGELISAEFPEGNLEFNWEDAIVSRLNSLGVQTSEQVSKNVFPNWLTDDCRSRLVERVQTIWAVRDLRKFMNKTLCVSLLGVEKVGKTTAGIYLFKHMAEQITSDELKGHTSSVKLYRHESVLVADFPGTNSKTEAFNLATEEYLSITDVAIVFLNLNISLQKSDFELLSKLKRVRTPVLVCMNKAGNSYRKRGSGRVNYFKTAEMVQERRQHWRNQLIENDFEISNWSIEIVELDKTEWYKDDSSEEISSKGMWLEEIGVWNIHKVRKWIRERKLRHDGQADFQFLDQVMPDNNMWWSIERDEDGGEEVIGWS
ncbi:hypothetical protein HDU77_002797 [Chytriomyces hyalinus]|nr:hypothetical protein HDU77_002797 [Chytriomyces hyalinus]